MSRRWGEAEQDSVYGPRCSLIQATLRHSDSIVRRGHLLLCAYRCENVMQCVVLCKRAFTVPKTTDSTSNSLFWLAAGMLTASVQLQRNEFPVWLSRDGAAHRTVRSENFPFSTSQNKQNQTCRNARPRVVAHRLVCAVLRNFAALRFLSQKIAAACATQPRASGGYNK